jgi:hypothetical protein
MLVKEQAKTVVQHTTSLLKQDKELIPPEKRLNGRRWETKGESTLSMHIRKDRRKVS